MEQMKKYIDANHLRSRMYNEAFEKDTGMQRWDSGCWIRYKLFETVLENEPDVMKHAHWEGWTATHWTKKYDDFGDPIFSEHTYYQCSACRRKSVIKENYCPSCGARMDEED